ncbi:hypothetical protein [Herbaspirillum sp. SJZ107]|uniref:hypothetical protein n=1 Tax=Herbaspirillum sp. SJZ107 TaxID=2572881 RepID=UPI001150E964|nr:hypothetical protein [Herbaspirillum sp. SJZ107]
MRRVLVIFLVLLFPLNVFALSLSVATMPAAALAQAAGAKDRVHVAAALADAGDVADDDAGSGDPGDIDPDEPPAGADIHYIVGHAGCLHIAGLSSASPALHDAAPRCHSVPPPVKPPRAA